MPWFKNLSYSRLTKNKKQRKSQENIKPIEFMFAGINMFWASIRQILARAVRRGLKLALSRPKRYIYLINQARGPYWENIGPRS